MGHTPLQNPTKFADIIDRINPLEDNTAGMPKHSKPTDPTRGTD